MEIIKPLNKELYKAVNAIKRGDIVICPTDTVYGFLADARNKKAVDKIFKIKNRPKSKPLPLFVEDLKTAGELAVIDERAAKILKKFWPGKYTFILKRKKEKKLYGSVKNTIAVRIPKYKFLNNLLREAGRPLAQTSVNISGQEPLKKIEDIIKIFGNEKKIAVIVDGGNLAKSNPSKITDLTNKNLTIIR